MAPALPTELRLRIDQELPALARETAAFGVARLLDYQDSAYAEEYLLRLAPFAKFDHSRDDTAAELTTSVARGLALWMSVEDTIRVADLKTRPGRTRRVRDSASAKSGQIVQITNFLRPRLEEICGTLPATLGARLRASSTATRWLSRWTRGREIRTSTITGYLSLRAIAGLRRWRRGTLRFREEQQRVERWLLQLQSLAVQNYALAVELAHCQSLVRGYGDTYERGVHEFEKLASTANNLAARDDGAAELRRLREQTLAA